MKNWKDNLRTIEPYVPGEQPDIPGMVKLNTNENPYPPSPKVIQAIKEFDADTLRLYPDPSSTVLKNAIVVTSSGPTPVNTCSFSALFPC